MSQHDMNIANQGFPSFRADLNNALGALVSNSSGATAPTTTVAYQMWYDTTDNLLKMRNADNDAWITLAYFNQTDDEWEVRSAVVQAVDASGLLLKTDDGTTRIDIQDDGDVAIDTDTLFVDATNNRVGIGTSAPNNTFHVSASSGDAIARIEAAENVGTADAQLRLQTESTIASGIIAFGDSADDFRGIINYDNGDDSMRISTAGTERMRIDSSGDVLLNKTVSSLGSVGHEFDSTGFAYHTRDGATALYVNRLNSSGGLISLRQDGVEEGFIGINGSNSIFIGSGVVGTSFIRLFNNTMRPANSSGDNYDNAMDCGSSVSRWDDIYATNGTIQTSDRNEKQDIEELSEAEQRVAQACKGLLRKFRWKDAVAEKGDDARIHFGIIAQDLKAAFEAEGLDAGRYAMFISSTWWEHEETYTDDEGVEQTRITTYESAEEAPEGAVERTRLGVRYPELLAFIIAAI